MSEDKIVEMVATRLDALAATLGTTVEYLWGVLVKQAAVSAAIESISALVCLALICLYAWLVWRVAIPAYKRAPKHPFDDGKIGPVMGITLGGMVAAISLIVMIDCIGDALTAALNPEYWALHEVLRYLRK